MRNFGILLLSVIAVLTASTASAQRIGSLPRHFLLLNPKVQAELKLTDAQKAAIKKAAGDAITTDSEGRVRVQISPGTDMDSLRDGLKRAITPSQDKRLTEIWIQRDGAFALADPDIAKTLGLSTDQKKQVETILDNHSDDMRGVAMSNGGRIGPEEAKSLREKAKKKLGDVLTASQKSKLETMKGSPFKMT